MLNKNYLRKHKYFELYKNPSLKTYNEKYAENYRKSDEYIKDDPLYLIFKDFLLRYFKKLNGEKSVLDLGCGTGRYFHLFNGEEISRFVGIDISKPMLEIC